MAIVGMTPHFAKIYKYERLEKLENKVLDLLYENGFPVTRDMAEAIAILIYKREDIAFNKEDYNKL